MKKLGILSLFLLSLVSCTTTSEDTQKLQTQYDIVYRIPNSNSQYVVIDSTQHVYNVKMGLDGSIRSTIRIK